MFREDDRDDRGFKKPSRPGTRPYEPPRNRKVPYEDRGPRGRDGRRGSGGRGGVVGPGMAGVGWAQWEGVKGYRSIVGIQCFLLPPEA